MLSMSSFGCSWRCKCGSLHSQPGRLGHAQGYTELLDMLAAHRRAHGWNLPVDVYGSGEDWDDIR